MSIASVEVVPYALPFKQPYVTARGTLERRKMVLLRLRDEEGVEGLGEAVPLSLRGDVSLTDLVAELEAFGERICDGRLDDERIAGMASATLSAAGRCAIETALLDLGLRHGRCPDRDPPLIGARAGTVRCNATLTAGAPEQVAADALAWAEDGFSTFKLKLGTGAEVEQVDGVRAVVGTDAAIRVDANASWDVATAARILEQIGELQIELAEQPVATLEEMADLKQHTSIPIAADESIVCPDQARHAALNGQCDLTTAKLSKVGGPGEAVNVALQLPTYMSSALDGPVGIAAAAHVALALPHLPADIAGGDAGLAHGLATQRLFSSTIAAVECELRGDMLHLPDGPGLGVAIDEDALARHRL